MPPENEPCSEGFNTHIYGDMGNSKDIDGKMFSFLSKPRTCDPLKLIMPQNNEPCSEGLKHTH